MTPVRFLKGHEHGGTCYLAGEVAGFPEDVAARMVRAGVASRHDAAKEAPAVVAPSAAPVQPIVQPEPPPDPAKEKADLQADSLSRTPTRAERRNRR